MNQIFHTAIVGTWCYNNRRKYLFSINSGVLTHNTIIIKKYEQARGYKG